MLLNWNRLWNDLEFLRFDLMNNVTSNFEMKGWTMTSFLFALHFFLIYPLKYLLIAKDAVLLFARYNYKSVDHKYRNSSNSKVRETVKYLKMINDLRHAKTEEQALHIIVNNKEITFDVVPPVLLKTGNKIWLNIIPRMTPDRLLSLINRLSRSKMFKYPEIVAEVIKKFEEPLQTTTHPIDVFITRKRYEEAPK